SRPPRSSSMTATTAPSSRRSAPCARTASMALIGRCSASAAQTLAISARRSDLPSSLGCCQIPLTRAPPGAREAPRSYASRFGIHDSGGRPAPKNLRSRCTLREWNAAPFTSQPRRQIEELPRQTETLLQVRGQRPHTPHLRRVMPAVVHVDPPL